MIGLGTLINTAAVILGGLLGLLLKNGLKQNVQDALMKACGCATIFIGASGTLAHMLVVGPEGISTQGTMLLIFSLVLGTALGVLLRIEDRMDNLGERIKKAVHREQDSRFVDGFVSVSLIICVGAMAIVGSFQDGVSGDWHMLAAKAALDCIIVMVFASTFGVGAVFSALAIFVYQGTLTLLAAFFGSFMTQAMIDGMSFVGSALIFCVGINISFGKKFPAGSMLPSVLIPVLWEVIANLV